MNIKCLIIDADILGRKLIEEHITTIPELALVGSFDNAAGAVKLLSKNAIDLVFLGVKMPNQEDIDMLLKTENTPKIVLLASQSENNAIVDCIQKPFSLDQFKKTVSKIIRSTEKTENGHATNSFTLKEGGMIHNINYEDLFYIEGYGNYLKVFTKEGMLLIMETLMNMETTLPEDKFLRVHKSYIISLSKIEKIEKNKIKIGKIEIPIGNMYKLELNKRLESSNKKYSSS